MTSELSDGTVHATETLTSKVNDLNPEAFDHAQNAKNAASREHDMTIREALRLYPKAIMFSLIFSTAIVMEGFDLSLMGAYWAFPAFLRSFGDQVDETGSPIVSAPWQSGVTNGVQAGSIIGLFINGYVSDLFGYRKTMFFAQLAMIGFIFLFFFAKNLGMLVAAAVLCGIPWGIFQTLSVTYAADVAPLCLRAYLTTYVNLCWVIGQLIAAGVARGFLYRTDQWGWRIPFALYWVLPPFILLGVYFSPESPWWLVRKRRYQEARQSLLALTSVNSGVEFNVDDQIAMYKATDDLEKSVNEGTNYWDCFQGVDLRRTEVACMAWLTQNWCGSSLMGYAPQLFRRAGLSESNTFNLNIGMYAMGGVGTVISWFLMSYFGRRTLYLCGLLVQILLLVGVGGSGIQRPANDASSWAGGALVLVYAFVYNSTLGPVCYSLVAEIPSTRLKIKTVVLARNLYNLAGIINNIIMPRMLGPNEWNWGSLSGFFWAGICGILFVYSFFRLPEPMGRTYGELDLLFEHHVSARKFATAKVEQFGTEIQVEVTSDSSSEEKGSFSHVE